MVSLKTVTDGRGSLTVIERLPFEIKRIYYLHSITPGSVRGGHAHRKLHRLMAAVNGRFAVTIGGGEVELYRPDMGLFIPPMAWIELNDFSDGAICLVLASEEHDEADCIRDYEEFKRLRA